MTRLLKKRRELGRRSFLRGALAGTAALSYPLVDSLVAHGAGGCVPETIGDLLFP